MSSPPLLSEYAPYTPRRSRPSQHSVLALNHLSRHALSRMLKRRTLKEEILSFYARQNEGLPNIPSYLANTVYAHLVKQQSSLFKKRLTRKPPTNEKAKIRVHHNLNIQGDDERMELTFQEYSLYNSAEKKIPGQEYTALEALLTQDHYNLTLAVQDLRLPTAWDVKAKGDHVEISSDHMQLTYTGKTFS